MTAPTDADALATRLRELRTGRGLKQPELARTLRVSVPSISAWEHGTIPPQSRLDAYGVIFGAPRTGARGRPQIAVEAELTAAERAEVHLLRRQLQQLREAALAEQGLSTVETPVVAAGLRSPLQFPTGQAITIVCSELTGPDLEAIPHSGRRDPDYIGSYRYADLDALVELHGFVRSLNPSSSVQIRTWSELTLDDRTAHLLLLGGIDVNSLAAEFLTYLRDVPVSQRERRTSAEVGSFRARTATAVHHFSPLLDERGEEPQLVEDVALFLRTPNPYNEERTATLFNGMFARGTVGVVRALSDTKIRERNTDYLSRRFAAAKTYAILSKVKVVANEVVVPDWTLDDIRLFEWSDADR
jgi:transcriptional regulator with XRE-family HTH domain